MSETEKHAGGRPTKYTPELLGKAREYVDSWESIGDSVPMLCAMAIHCDISEETLHEWRHHDDKEEFSELCARVMGKQKRGLINGGLSRKLDAGISKLMLNKHGISDKQEIEMKVDSPNIINDLATGRSPCQQSD